MSAVPGSHTTHVVWPAREKEPELQLEHSVVGSESASAVPGSHAMQLAVVAYPPGLLVVVAYPPGLHVMHAVIDEESWSYCTPEHGLHESAPLELSVSVTLPGPHGVHMGYGPLSFRNSPGGQAKVQPVGASNVPPVSPLLPGHTTTG